MLGACERPDDDLENRALCNQLSQRRRGLSARLTVSNHPAQRNGERGRVAGIIEQAIGETHDGDIDALSADAYVAPLRFHPAIVILFQEQRCAGAFCHFT